MELQKVGLCLQEHSGTPSKWDRRIKVIRKYFLCQIFAFIWSECSLVRRGLYLTAMRIFLSFQQEPNDTFSYLLGFHPIHNRVHCGRHEKIEVSHDNVYVWRNGASPKTVCKEGEEGWHVGDDDGADVGSARAKSFLSSIC